MTPVQTASTLPGNATMVAPTCAPELRERTRRQWQRQLSSAEGLWVFGYGSLIWRPEFDAIERRPARVYGWHRALAMWSHINRGTPAQPGLVFAMLPGGSCLGFVFRIPADDDGLVFDRLWAREMPDDVYDPNWLTCRTPRGTVRALTFTLSPKNPAYTGALTPAQYRHVFSHASGRYGTTLDYARDTFNSLNSHGIHDRALAEVLAYAVDPQRTNQDPSCAS